MPLTFFDKPLVAAARLTAGTHRTTSLRATWQRFSPLATEIGLVRLADLTGLDTIGIPVISAIRPMSRSLSTQQGKGLTLEAARVSALMEALETYHAETLRLPITRGAAAELARRHLLAPLAALPAGPGQPRAKRARERALRTTKLAWVEGFDLVSRRSILVPEEAVTLDCVLGGRAPLFDISSNGLASGNCLTEAILHGLCEVIERDAEARWRRERGQRRLLLDSIDDPACVALLTRFTSAGVRVVVWDLTSDVGVPVFGCSILENPDEPAWRALGCYQGFGCHLAPEVALARALTEAAQTRLTYIAGARDDFFPFDYERATDRDLLREVWRDLDETPYEPVRFAELPALATGQLGVDLERVVAKLVACGDAMVIAVDLSRPALGVPVVKVLVPGRACDVEVMG